MADIQTATEFADQELQTDAGLLFESIRHLIQPQARSMLTDLELWERLLTKLNKAWENGFLYGFIPKSKDILSATSPRRIGRLLMRIALFSIDFLKMVPSKNDIDLDMTDPDKFPFTRLPYAIRRKIYENHVAMHHRRISYFNQVAGTVFSANRRPQQEFQNAVLFLLCGKALSQTPGLQGRLPPPGKNIMRLWPRDEVVQLMLSCAVVKFNDDDDDWSPAEVITDWVNMTNAVAESRL
jgi:hypothetical protein